MAMSEGRESSPWRSLLLGVGIAVLLLGAIAALLHALGWSLGGAG